jgi:DNA-directed RNA polymerase beta subunit
MDESMNKFSWDAIDCYFRDDPQSLVRHHIDSYNYFFKEDIFKILREMNPITVVSKYDDKTRDYKSKCKLYRGGKTGQLVYLEKVATASGREMYPNEARIMNKTYACDIYYDIEVELLNVLDKNESPIDYERPLNENEDEETADMFKNPKRDKQFLDNIIQRKGKEHVDNDDTLQNGGTVSRKLTVNESIELNKRFNESVNEQTGDQTYKFILKRVFLGRFPIMVQSDLCLLSGLPKEMRYNMGECKNDLGGYFIIDGKEKTFTPKVELCNNTLRIEKSCIEICSVSENYAKPKSTLRIEHCADKCLVVTMPHVSKPIPLFTLFRALGLVSDKEIIQTCLFDLSKHEDMLDEFTHSVYAAAKIMSQTDAILYIAELTEEKSAAYVLMILSDFLFPHIGETNYVQKAFFLGHMTKCLLYRTENAEEKRVNNNYFCRLFSEYCDKQSKHVSLAFQNVLFNEQSTYEDRLDLLVQNHYKEVFSKYETIEQEFKELICDPLDRTSYVSTLAHLRKIDGECRMGVVDFIDGEQLSLLTHITTHIPRDYMIKWLCENNQIYLLDNCTHQMLSVLTKLFVNGYWLGGVENPLGLVENIKFHRRNGLIHPLVSVYFNIPQNTIFVYTDAGRLSRPLCIRSEVPVDKYTWRDLVSGFNKRRTEAFGFYKLSELYEEDPEADPTKLKRYREKSAAIEYIDQNEEHSIVIGSSFYREIHECLVLGALSNLSAFPHHNHPDNISASLQFSKKAASMYSTNFNMRVDESATVLNQGQRQLVRSRFGEYLNVEENVYGENVIVAIACYDGYNAQHAVVVNEGSVKRGLFRTTEFTMTKQDIKSSPVQGFVHKTFAIETETKVCVRNEVVPSIGDVISSREGLACGIGLIVAEADMPFTKDGIRPDIIVNPLSNISVAQLIEMIVGKACMKLGYHGDCTAFNSNGTQLGDFAQLLVESGMHSSGNNILYNGMTGEQMESEIFMGPTYYMFSKHREAEYRASAAKDSVTRQAVEGIEFSECERDAIIAHGAAEFLRDAWDDNYYIAVCNKTGGIAIYNEDKNVFISPWIDGPLKFVDSLDGKNKNIEQITKFGRSFSVIRVPYAFKTFLQEMQAMNVKMSIITDDNVSQFDNMKFSKVKFDLPKPIEEKERDEYLFSDDDDFDSILDSDSDSDDDHPRITIEGGDAKIKYDTLHLPNDENISSLISQSETERHSREEAVMNNVFNVGDAVHFNGDFNKSRVWTVEEFDKGFAVLKTGNTEGLESNMKVVHLNDIVPAVSEPVQVAQPALEESPVKFSPVFNIVTGDGNKIEACEPQTFVDVKHPVETQSSIQANTEEEPADIFSKPLIKKSVNFAGETPSKHVNDNKLLSSGSAIVIKKLS